MAQQFSNLGIEYSTELLGARGRPGETGQHERERRGLRAAAARSARWAARASVLAALRAASRSCAAALLDLCSPYTRQRGKRAIAGRDITELYSFIVKELIDVSY